VHRIVDNLVAVAGVAADPPQDANAPNIKITAADATRRSTSSQEAEEAFAPKLPPILKHLSTFGPRAALAACVSGVAWVAGSYFSGDQSQFYAVKPQPNPTTVAQESVERAEFLRMKQKFGEEIRVLQAKVEAIPAARSLSTKEATALEDLKKRLDAVKREAGAAIAELAGKVERMQRENATTFSQVSEQIGQPERQIAAKVAASSRAVDSAAVGIIQKRRLRTGRGDAFDPSQNPGAASIPHPLGNSAQSRAR
jgi:hypothetical protein